MPLRTNEEPLRRASGSATVRAQAIHERISAGDPTASADLFQLLHTPIVRVLRSRFGWARLSVEECGDLATDAIVGHLVEPHRYDDARAGLLTFLCFAAGRDALNLIRAKGGRARNFARLVELSGSDGNSHEDDMDRRLDAQRLFRSHLNGIAEDDMDRAVLDLMLLDESETDAYAAVLGLGGLSKQQQREEVKRRRDRIEKRLRRLGAKL